MAKFYLEMSIKGAIEIDPYLIDDDTYDELGVDDEIDYDDADEATMYFDLVRAETVMTYDELCDCDTFSLKVRDENNNVVYETKNPDSIKMYTYYKGEFGTYNDDENTNEDGDLPPLPNFNFKNVPDGKYLIENFDLKWDNFEGEFEADEFDPSKLAFYPSEYLNSEICDDEVFLTCLRYDGKELDIEESWTDAYGNRFKLLTKEDDNWSDIH